MADLTRMERSEAEERAIDAKRPTLEQRGEKRMYHVGLLESAPFDAITVPTVILKGTLRGKCVSVPKKTANVHMGPNGILTHLEGGVAGAFEELYDIEVQGFLDYIRTHVFRKTSEYEVAVVGKDGKAVPGQKKKMWRAEIETLDPAGAGGSRSLHDEKEVTRETMEKYVWISLASVGRTGKPNPGEMVSVADQKANGTFALPIKPKAVEPPAPSGNQNKK